MAKRWLSIRSDWTFKRSLKLIGYRLAIHSVRGVLGGVNCVVHTPIAIVRVIGWTGTKLGKAASTFFPHVEKLALIAHAYVDDSFAKSDKVIGYALEEINALPWGGKFIDYAELEPADEALTQDETIQTIADEDIAKSIALYDGSILLACRSGAGKTTTMHTSMNYAGDADFWIIDGKGSAWLGHEKNPERYFLCNHPSLIPKAIEALTYIVTVEMRRRQDIRLANGGNHPIKPRRIVIVCDEFNNVVTFADMVKLGDELCNLVTLIINMGREDLVNWWGVGQSHLVKELKLSTGTQKNLAFVCQGRNYDYQSIEGAIGDYNLVPNAKERKRLQMQLDVYLQSENDHSLPICFTTIGGKRIVKLPSAKQGHGTSTNVTNASVSDSTLLPSNFQDANRHVPVLASGSTNFQGFEVTEVLQKENFDPTQAPENGGCVVAEVAPNSGRWEEKWDVNFWRIFQAITQGSSDYQIGKDIFGITSGSSYQRLKEKLNEVRASMRSEET